MRFVKKGDSGAEVKILQTRLKELDFNPGKIDSFFGPATQAAVLGFQKSYNLLPDGIAGPKTYISLDLAPDHEIDSAIEKDIFYNVIPAIDYKLVSKLMPDTPVANIKKNLPVLLKIFKEEKLTDKYMVLTAIGLIRAESETFEPVEEKVSISNTSPGGKAFDLYDYRRDLGNHGPPDGEKYKGRGFIKLTGRFNYFTLAEKLGIDLEEEPELALNIETASKILVYCLKENENNIKQALLDNNIKAARRFVDDNLNGLDVFREVLRTGKILI